MNMKDVYNSYEQSYKELKKLSKGDLPDDLVNYNKYYKQELKPTVHKVKVILGCNVGNDKYKHKKILLKRLKNKMDIYTKGITIMVDELKQKGTGTVKYSNLYLHYAKPKIRAIIDELKNIK